LDEDEIVPPHAPNASGTLTVADVGIVNANLTRALPAP
jgi:hypothetical protein